MSDSIPEARALMEQADILQYLLHTEIITIEVGAMQRCGKLTDRRLFLAIDTAGLRRAKKEVLRRKSHVPESGGNNNYSRERDGVDSGNPISGNSDNRTKVVHDNVKFSASHSGSGARSGKPRKKPWKLSSQNARISLKER